MKVVKLGSATVVIKTDDVNILCDPWLTDGIYYGSWCNYPPINLDLCDFSDIDYVYISHVHPDHFDPKTMNLLNPETPVLIHKYHQKFLKANIERLGFKVIELDNAIPFQLSKTSKLSIYAADNCDPSICGKMFGCIGSEIKGSMQLDSLCVIDDGTNILVNTNDCPYGISKNTLEVVKRIYPKIDFALVGYTSASLYPHCMMDFNQNDMDAGIVQAKESGLSTAIQTLQVLQPDSYMPFAGTYIIGGREYQKNRYLPIPEIQDAVLEIQNKLAESNVLLNPVLLNFNESYDVHLGVQSAPYTPIDKDARAQYINDIAKHFSYDFDDDIIPSDDELFEMFKVAIVRLKGKQQELKFYEDINLLFDLPSGAFALINLESGDLTKITSHKKLSNRHRFKLDPRLLARVLKGPRFANWNNIEIGALLDFSRKPDTYRMDVHVLINALHI
jgi:UDP-MurNAc hydroxylase